MNNLQSFFIFCSGANRTILKRTPIEINKYASMGATVFFTGLFAAVAAGYACYTIFNHLGASMLMGILWGTLIFNLDRYIVSTMIKKDTLWSNLATAAPRILLALLIAIVIAKPLELKIFESEIESELVLMEQEKYKSQDELTQSRYQGQIDTLNEQIALWKSEIETKANNRDQLLALANAEADGTGGSMQKNLGPIYKVKKDASDKAQQELNDIMLQNQGLISYNQERITEIRADMASNLKALKRVSLSGFAARLEGLERAEQRSEAIYMAVLFITLLFICIELSPIITKLMMPKGPYDYAIQHHNGLYASRYDLPTTKAAMDRKNKKSFYAQTSEHRLKEAIKAEKEMSDIALQERVEKIKNRRDLWDDYRKDGEVVGI